MLPQLPLFPSIFNFLEVTPSFAPPPHSEYAVEHLIIEIAIIIKHSFLFSNVAMTHDGGVWWEGMGPKPKATKTNSINI